MDLFDINLDASALSDFGLKGPTGRLIKARLKRRVDDLALDCVRAFQSAVPIDTGALRESIEFAEYSDTASQQYSARVYIAEGPHISRRGQVMGTGALAKLLQTNKDLKRSRASEAFADYPTIPGGTPTELWIDRGREDFLNIYKRDL
jgi:hypothetical protein